MNFSAASDESVMYSVPFALYAWMYVPSVTFACCVSSVGHHDVTELSNELACCEPRMTSLDDTGVPRIGVPTGSSSSGISRPVYLLMIARLSCSMTLYSAMLTMRAEMPVTLSLSSAMRVSFLKAGTTLTRWLMPLFPSVPFGSVVILAPARVVVSTLGLLPPSTLKLFSIHVVSIFDAMLCVKPDAQKPNVIVSSPTIALASSTVAGDELEFGMYLARIIGPSSRTSTHARGT